MGMIHNDTVNDMGIILFRFFRCFRSFRNGNDMGMVWEWYGNDTVNDMGMIWEWSCSDLSDLSVRSGWNWGMSTDLPRKLWIWTRFSGRPSVVMDGTSRNQFFESHRLDAKCRLSVQPYHPYRFFTYLGHPVLIGYKMLQGTFKDDNDGWFLCPHSKSMKQERHPGPKMPLPFQLANMAIENPPAYHLF